MLFPSLPLLYSITFFVCIFPFFSPLPNYFFPPFNSCSLQTLQSVTKFTHSLFTYFFSIGQNFCYYFSTFFCPFLVAHIMKNFLNRIFFVMADYKAGPFFLIYFFKLCYAQGTYILIGHLYKICTPTWVSIWNRMVWNILLNEYISSIQSESHSHFLTFLFKRSAVDSLGSYWLL